MISTLLPPDAASYNRRDTRENRNVTKIAYNSLLNAANELHVCGSITDKEFGYLERGLTEAYLERIAALYLERKLGHVIDGLNDNLCSAIGVITDPFQPRHTQRNE